MSTANDGADTGDLGECVVCGKLSSLRCSSCSSNGLKWMFFCSAEHQRFIWFAHKRVCNSNVFKWPWLTKEEQAQWRTLKNFRNPARPDWESVVNSMGVTFEEMLGRYDSAFRKKAEWDGTLEDRTVELVRWRGLAYSLQQEKIVEDSRGSSPKRPEDVIETYKRYHEDPFGVAAHHINTIFPAIDLLTVKDGTWISDLEHRILILTAVVCQNNKEPNLELSNSRLPFLHYTISQVKALLDDPRVSKEWKVDVRKFKASLDEIKSVQTLRNPKTGEKIALWFFDSESFSPYC